MKPNIFISWSEDSKDIALVIKRYIKAMMPQVDVYMSRVDMPSGVRWVSEIAKRLELSNYGILCLTPANAQSAWILFEAGALTKLADGKACSLLFKGMTIPAIREPLAHFQNRVFNKEDFYLLMRDINNSISVPTTTDDLDFVFNKLWESIDKDVKDALEAKTAEKSPPERSEREMLGEVIERIGGIENTMRSLMDAWGRGERGKAGRIKEDEDRERYRDQFFLATLALSKEAVPSDWLRGVGAMKQVLGEEADNRSAAMYLGRIHRKISESGIERRKSIDDAIEVLSKFVDTKTRRGEEDGDVADVLYNRACYQVRKRDYIMDGELPPEEGRSEMESKETLFQKAMEDLARSVRLSRGNKTDAQNDIDFDSIRDRVEFKRAIGGPDEEGS